MVTVQLDLRRLGPADWVTTARLVLSCAVAALVATALAGPDLRLAIVALASVALVLDAVDGRVARWTGTASPAGGRYDMEVDALLILVLSVYVAAVTAPWALLIGAARYLLLVAGWCWPWLRASVPPRYWGKVVAAVQGIALVVAVSGLLPRPVVLVLLATALVLLAESFGHQVRQLRQLRLLRRPDHRPEQRDRSPRTSPRPRRPVLSGALTLASYAVLWLALVLPMRLADLSAAHLVRLPLELVVLLALALVLPPAARRALGIVFGVLAALVVVVKALDIGFIAVLDRPVDPMNDLGFLGPALGVLRDSDGSAAAAAAAVGVGLGALGLVVVLPLAAVRVAGAVARRRRSAAPVIAVLGLGWVVGSVAGLNVAAAPVASSASSALAVDQIRQVRFDLADRRVFAREISTDRFAATPAGRLLTGLRGKDVIVAFVESYGRVAVQGTTYSPGIDAVLTDGTRRLAAAGFSARSAFLTSPTFGGVSWVAHATFQSGTWVDSEQRYSQLLGSHRLTLAAAFHRAGWRTVFDVPSNTEDWPEGQRFYGFDALYDARNVGYHGPRFGYATMPDQYIWSAFAQRELGRSGRGPVMAEIDLVSSHHPWTPLPRPVAWDAVGDGSVYDGTTDGQPSADDVLGSTARVRAAYGASVEYSLGTLVSFLERHPDPNLVLVVLGDHQPHSYVTGADPGHDVPVSVIAHDPAVMSRIAGWDWQAGLLPHPDAPVWRMDQFRDRFLTAFGPTGVVPHR